MQNGLQSYLSQSSYNISTDNLCLNKDCGSNFGSKLKLNQQRTQTAFK